MTVPNRQHVAGSNRTFGAARSDDHSEKVCKSSDIGLRHSYTLDTYRMHINNTRRFLALSSSVMAVPGEFTVETRGVLHVVTIDDVKRVIPNSYSVRRLTRSESEAKD